MQKKLPPYVEEMIRAVFEEQEFEVDPARVPKDWSYERKLLEPDHWMITVIPKKARTARAFRRVFGPGIYCVARVGRFSYNFICPLYLVPGEVDLSRTTPVEQCSVLPLLTPDGTVVPIMYPPSGEVA